MSLVGQIAAVHVVYRECCDCIHWFGQLTSHRPGILESLVEQTTDQKDSMMLHLFAVRKILNKLDPPLEGKRVSLFSDEKSLGVWLSSVRKIRRAIESTLCIPSQHEIALSLRLKWQRVRTFQLFTEHILLEHPNLIPFAKRLYLTLGNNPDFLTCSPIKTLKQTLNNILKK
jgi:hypothetical protein